MTLGSRWLPTQHDDDAHCNLLLSAFGARDGGTHDGHGAFD
jgi:hypothetical protein